MANFFESITIQDFKNYFAIRKAFTFNTAPLWNNTSATPYTIDDKVYDSNFDIYTSLVDSNTQPLTNTTSWAVEKYTFLVFDEFITEAFTEALSKISAGINKLPNTDARKKEAYLLLSAHCLLLLLQEREQMESSIAFSSSGFVGSESANGVSVSYAKPNDFTLSDAWFASTQYGIKYSVISKQVTINAPFVVKLQNAYSS